MNQRLAATDPTDVEAQRDLSISYVTLGDVSLQAGQLAQALGYYTKALDIRQKLAAADPTNAEAQRDLSISFTKLGDVTLKMGQPAKALEYYSKYFDISQKLAAADPTNAQAQRDLSISYNNLGDVTLTMGQPAQALEYYTKLVVISQGLATADPTNAQAQTDFVVCCLKLGQVEEALANPHETLTWYKRGLDVLHKLQAEGRLAPSFEHYFPIFEQRILACRRLVELDGKLPAILRGEAKPKNNPERLAIADLAYKKRWYALAAKMFAEAFAADPKLADDLDTGHRYNAGCAAALAGSGQGKDEPPPDAAAQAKLRGQAIVWLKADLAAYTKMLDPGDATAKKLVTERLQHWQTDSDLAGVREEAALAKLPEAERAACQALWNEVKALLARAASEKK